MPFSILPMSCLSLFNSNAKDVKQNYPKPQIFSYYPIIVLIPLSTVPTTLNPYTGLDPGSMMPTLGGHPSGLSSMLVTI